MICATISDRETVAITFLSKWQEMIARHIGNLANLRAQSREAVSPDSIRVGAASFCFTFSPRGYR